jgi:hypothetical protein
MINGWKNEADIIMTAMTEYVRHKLMIAQVQGRCLSAVYVVFYSYLLRIRVGTETVAKRELNLSENSNDYHRHLQFGELF